MNMINSDPHTDISDYHSIYIADANDTVCEFKPLHVNDGNGFFEISTLQGLKSLHNKVRHRGIRRNFYTVIYLTAGTIEESIKLSKYLLKPGTVYFIPENTLSTTHHWSDDVTGYHLVFDSDFFLLCEKNQIRLNAYPFFNEWHQPFMELSDAGRSSTERLLQNIASEFRRSKITKNDSLVKLYLNALMIEFERGYRRTGEPLMVAQSRKEQLTTAFKKLVAQQAGKLKQVAEFAELLNITPHYLNDIVKENTGLPASKIIQSQIVSLAKSYLVQTTMTVLEIATTLNFSDQSYFIRLFKKHTGVSPLKFRQQQKI